MINQKIKNQFPSLFNEEYGALIDFVKKYYEFLTANAYDRSLTDLFDVDKADEEFFLAFREQYAKEFPTESAFSKRELLPLLREYYQGKGTPDALRFLFRAIYGDEVAIGIPGNRIIKASGPGWSQFNMLTVYVNDGSIRAPQIGDTLEIVDSSGAINATTVLDVKSLSNENESLLPGMNPLGTRKIPIYRVYFSLRDRLPIGSNSDIVSVRENSTAFRQVVAKITPLKSVSEIKLLHSGSGWEVGEVITLVGTREDTALRVRQTTPAGKIVRFDTAKHGFDHDASRTYYYMPSGEAIDSSIWSMNFQYNDPVLGDAGGIKQTLNFNDKTILFRSGASMGWSDLYQNNPNSGYLATEGAVYLRDYYSDGYIAEGYMDDLPPLPVGPYFVNGYLTPGYFADPEGLETWIEPGYVYDLSQTSADVDAYALMGLLNPIQEQARFQGVKNSYAIFRINKGFVVKSAGFFDHTATLVSDDRSRLQDNYFFQKFSYVVETDVKYEKAKKLLEHFNPAGLMPFIVQRVRGEVASTQEVVELGIEQA